MIFVVSLTDDKTDSEIECACQLGLTNGIRFEETKLGNQFMSEPSENCDPKYFDTCLVACNEKVFTFKLFSTFQHKLYNRFREIPIISI